MHAAAAYQHFVGKTFEQFVPRPPRVDNVKWFAKHATDDFPKNQFFTFGILTIRIENGLLKNGPRRFSFKKTLGEVQELFTLAPLTDRCIEEVIKTDTPHRFALDLERDGIDANAVQECKDGIFTHLLPLLCEFLSSFLQRTVTAEHWTVLFACSQVKFSAHVTLLDFYFTSRTESEFLAHAMETFLYGVQDPNFQAWYKFYQNDKRKCIIDYAIYHKGTRNMRAISAIKISAKGSPISKYEELRPLLPHDPSRPLTDYLVTAVTRRLHKVEFSEDDKKEIRKNYMKIPANERAKRSLTTNKHTTAPVAVPFVNNPLDFVAVQDPFLNLMHRRLLEIKDLEDFPRMNNAAQKLATDLCHLIHPFNPSNFHEVGPGEICRLMCKAKVFDTQGAPIFRDDGQEQRMCFWSYSLNEHVCQQGTHSVVISVLCDFSVKYYCFACKNNGFLIRSPFSSNTIRPKFYNSGPPDELTDLNLRYINYADGNNPSLYMQEIQELPGGGLVGAPRTIFLHGSMGSGKSYTTSKFIADSHVKRILSITFRTMLAKSNAQVFNLEYYNNSFFTHGDLSSLDRIAIQLDSIERIAATSEINGCLATTFTTFDLVILDESESILNHISASTLDGKKNKIFSFLENITKYAKTVIVADADLSPRSFAFIADTRGHSHIEFHRNPFVLKHTEFVDYKFKHRWIEQLIVEIFDKKKKIFVVSNSKSQLYHLETRIRREESKHGIEDFDFVKVLSSDMSGPDKEAMAESVNIEWKKYQVLMISPVVGAGISFDEKHYDEAFVFATPRSCVPREVCQLMGRVRNLLKMKVHVYIQPKRTDRVQTKPTKNLQKRLRRRQKETLLDFVGHDEEQGTFTFVERREVLLNKILLMNEEEKKRGREEFRNGFIETLQRNNPTLNYHFDDSGSYQEEMKLDEQYNDFREQNEEFSAGKISSQLEAPGINFDDAKRRNQAGLPVSDLPEIQENIVPLIIQDETKKVLGLTRNLSDEEKDCMEKYLLVFGSEPGAFKKKVDDFMAYFVYTAEEAFNVFDKNNIKPVVVSAEPMVYEKTKTQISLSGEHLKATVNEWVQRILFFFGHCSDCKFHNKLMRERIYTQEAQTYFATNVPLIQQCFADFPSLKDKPKYNKKYDLNIVADGCTIRAFANYVTKNVLHVGDLQKGEICVEHEGCKVVQPSRFLKDVLRKIALRRLWVENNVEVYEREKARVVDDVLPPLMESFEQMVSCDSPASFIDEIDRMKIKETERFEKMQRSKGSQGSKFDLEWKKSTACFLEQDVYAVGQDQHFVVPGEEFVRNVLDASYKARTKRFMSDVVGEMNQKRRRLLVNQ